MKVVREKSGENCNQVKPALSQISKPMLIHRFVVCCCFRAGKIYMKIWRRN